jgi:hypothetical protein
VVALAAGEPGEAERELRAGTAAFQQMGEKAHLASATAALGRALLAQGRTADAILSTREAEAFAAPDDVAVHATWRAVRAVAMLPDSSTADAASNPGSSSEAIVADARRLASEAVQLAGRTDALVLQADALSHRATVLDAAGDSDGAAADRARALRLLQRKGVLVAAPASPPLAAAGSVDTAR